MMLKKMCGRLLRFAVFGPQVPASTFIVMFQKGVQKGASVRLYTVGRDTVAIRSS